MINQEIQQRIKQTLKRNRKISFLVGAGLSADSGIPTFRDADGFWTIGSKNYTPQEIGTKKFFDHNANEVWKWFLYRISFCRKAKPNNGHKSLVQLELKLKDRFELISQNVDGLHFVAGNSENKTHLIHGDLRYMRCSEECSNELYHIPDSLFSEDRTRDTPLSIDDTQLLKCPKCDEDTRPHVLWFDEFYDEKFYKLETTLRIAKHSGILFVTGTSGATNLPRRIVETTLSRNGIVIDINPNDNYFSDHLKSLKNGFRIKGGSSEILAEIVNLVT